MPKGTKTRYVLCGVRGVLYKEAGSLMSVDRRVQLIDAEVVFGPGHVESAVAHASRAFEQKRNTCRELRAELMLYLSGERQISTAIKVAGIKKGTKRCAMLVLDPKKGEPGSIIKKMGWRRDDRLLSAKGKRLSRLGISKDEIRSTDRPLDLALERVALVDIIKRR